jgi:hypothetical protein
VRVQRKKMPLTGNEQSRSCCSNLIATLPEQRSQTARASEAPALSSLCARRGTRRENFPQQKMMSDCSRYRERELEELVPSLLCQRAEGGEELTQAVHERGK